MGTSVKTWIGNTVKQTDWTLLVFLILILNVKLAIKVMAVLAIYLLRFNFKFRLQDSRLPVFYFLITGIACLHFISSNSYANPVYVPVFFTGLAFWTVCILIAHQTKLAVENQCVDIIHRTILVFFTINALVSMGNFLLIVGETGSLNPYSYQGSYQKYFINTGDYIKGISWDTSTTNAIINAYGVIYFLFRKNALMLLVCMMILLLTGSNVVNIILSVTLIYIFICKSDANQKSLIVTCMMLFVVFMVKISPQNNQYLKETYENLTRKSFKTEPPLSPTKPRAMPDNTLINDEKKLEIAKLYLHRVRMASDKKKPDIFPGHVLRDDTGKPTIPQPDIHSLPFQSRNDTSLTRKGLLRFIGNKQLEKAETPSEIKEIPGKITALIQTLTFFEQNPEKLILGEGPGNFSSKLAFRVTGLKIAGGYPLQYAYIHPDFLSNHLKLYLHFFSKPARQHSLINSPNSVYTQLLAEYGLPGLLVFVLFYLRYFVRHYKTLTYGAPLLIMLTGILFIDYWFEQLSVIILFELMLFLNIKETSTLPKNEPQ